MRMMWKRWVLMIISKIRSTLFASPYALISDACKRHFFTDIRGYKACKYRNNFSIIHN